MMTHRPSNQKEENEEKKNNFSSNFTRLNLPLHGVRLPSFQIEQRYINDLALDKNISTYNFLRELCLRRFKSLGLDKGDLKSTYIDRIKYELEIYPFIILLKTLSKFITSSELEFINAL